MNDGYHEQKVTTFPVMVEQSCYSQKTL